MKKQKIVPNRIPWWDHKQGEVVTLAKIGIATKVIAESTNLTEGQVRNRMKQADVRLGDWRYGRSELSRWAARCMVSAMKLRYRQETPKNIGPSTLSNDKLMILAWPDKRKQ